MCFNLVKNYEVTLSFFRQLILKTFSSYIGPAQDVGAPG